MFSFDGYRIDEITFSQEIVQVQLRLDGRKKRRCPNCHRKTGSDFSEFFNNYVFGKKEIIIPEFE